MRKNVKLDPILAVKDLNASASWYETLLAVRDIHGGNHFKILVDESHEVILCLHPWEKDRHPTMMDPAISPGNGLILYFRVNDLNAIRANAGKLDVPIVEEIHLNQNSNQLEFALRDPDGYYVIVTEAHDYGGL
ncbi:MAG: hypothetical protein J5I59_13650 [Saprospiraceae bacterium]|nr:hypothetical protein [Saprospiraceae bacterium]